MINGDIDLTENLDFYHDREDNKPVSTKMIPWRKDKEKSLTSITYNIDLYGENRNETYITSSSLLNWQTYNLYTWQNLSTSTNIYTTAASTLENYNQLIEVYNNAMTTSTISVSYLDENNHWILSDNDYMMQKEDKDIYTYNSNYFIPIFGERKHKNDKSLSIKYKYCCDCRTYYHLGCKCNRTNMKSVHNHIFANSRQRDRENKLDSRSAALISRILDNINYYIESALHLHHLVGSRNRRYSSVRDRFDKSSRKIPWLRKLDSRIYNDYIEDLEEEKDYSRYLTDMSWLRMN